MALWDWIFSEPALPATPCRFGLLTWKNGFFWYDMNFVSLSELGADKWGWPRSPTNQSRLNGTVFMGEGSEKRKLKTEPGHFGVRVSW